ncbi:Uncharacterised protein [Serratia rubidaea]|uniref:Uncharacterized protein n=1 Tax=Serratia rubidaea TaxID=61652 RepID=A0A4U9HC37_SERRU|nr:Uncharacterised protein [Serratia rubidaea]
MNKPVVLSDLDDTLFQTRRKMVGELAQQPFRTAALDKDLHPRSFMNEEQSMLVDWLLAQAELIPVTAVAQKKSAGLPSPSARGPSRHTALSFWRRTGRRTRSGRQ